MKCETVSLNCFLENELYIQFNEYLKLEMYLPLDSTYIILQGIHIFKPHRLCRLYNCASLRCTCFINKMPKAFETLMVCKIAYKMQDVSQDKWS